MEKKPSNKYTFNIEENDQEILARLYHCPAELQVFARLHARTRISMMKRRYVDIQIVQTLEYR